MSLSKSNFVKGVQCPKMLWLAAHAADEGTELDNSLVFENGHRVGELAKGWFGEYVEVAFDRDDKPGMIAETERYLAEGRVNICEASFGHDGLFCMVDILHRNEDGSFDMIEVKSSTHLKEMYLYDIAFQYRVLTLSGITVRKAYCMYINKEYVRRGDLSIEDFFILEDCTARAKGLQQEVERNLGLIKAALDSETEPAIGPGPQCDDPYECEFKRYCGAPVQECPDIREAAPAEARAKSFAGRFSYPFCCLWIDLCGWPIPPYDGMRPYKQTPFHYSLYTQYADGREEQQVFFPDVAPGAEADPRRALAESLCRNIPDKAVIVTCRRGTEAFDSNVEARLIKNLAYTFWDLKDRLLDISGRCVDIADAFGPEYCLRCAPPEGLKEVDSSYLYLHEKSGEKIAAIRERIQEQGRANILTIRNALSDVLEASR